MFCYPAWAVGSYSSGPSADGTVRTKSPGGFYQADVSPCILSGVSSIWVYSRLSEELFIFENPAFPRDVVRKIDGQQRHKNVKIVTGLFVAHKLEGGRLSITLWCHKRASRRECVSQWMLWMTGKAAVTHPGLPLFGNGSCVREGQSLSLNLSLSASFLFLSLYFPAIHVILMWIEDTITSHNEHLVTVVSAHRRWMELLLQRSTYLLVESL